MRIIPFIVVISALLLGTGLAASAADNSPDTVAAPRPLALVPFATIPPRIDASEDDPAWTSAITLAPLVLGTDSPAGQVALPTTVKLMWDPDFLYVRIIADGKLVPFCSARSADVKISSEDCIGVIIDPRGESNGWAEIFMNPTGKLRAQVYWITGTTKTGPTFRLSGEAVASHVKHQTSPLEDELVSAASYTSTGWMVDIAIPATTLLGAQGITQLVASTTMRANFLRYDYALGEDGIIARTATDWATVLAGQEDLSPQGMGYMRLEPAPK